VTCAKAADAGWQEPLAGGRRDRHAKFAGLLREAGHDPVILRGGTGRQ
jgi:hypothetical protein